MLNEWSIIYTAIALGSSRTVSSMFDIYCVLCVWARAREQKKKLVMIKSWSWEREKKVVAEPRKKNQNNDKPIKTCVYSNQVYTYQCNVIYMNQFVSHMQRVPASGIEKWFSTNMRNLKKQKYTAHRWDWSKSRKIQHQSQIYHNSLTDRMSLSNGFSFACLFGFVSAA